jgi:hypothetical protein
MRPIGDAGTSDLALVKPSWRTGLYELVSGSETVARLDVSAWTGGSVGQAADGLWRFDRTRGFTQRRVQVFLGQADDKAAVALATFRRNGWWRGGAVDVGGHSYRLVARGWWRSDWTWFDGDVELLALSTRGTLGREKGRVRFSADGVRSPHASLLALLGVHIALLTARETSAAAGGAASAGVIAAG